MSERKPVSNDQLNETSDAHYQRPSFCESKMDAEYRAAERLYDTLEGEYWFDEKKLRNSWRPAVLEMIFKIIREEMAKDGIEAANEAAKIGLELDQLRARLEAKAKEWEKRAKGKSKESGLLGSRYEEKELKTCAAELRQILGEK